jgi:hypothetical protein
MADRSNIIYVDGDEFRITDIFREDVLSNDDYENYVIEAELNCSPASYGRSIELVLTREAAINLMANLMELLNKVGE